MTNVAGPSGAGWSFDWKCTAHVSLLLPASGDIAGQAGDWIVQPKVQLAARISGSKDQNVGSRGAVIVRRKYTGVWASLWLCGLPSVRRKGILIIENDRKTQTEL